MARGRAAGVDDRAATSEDGAPEYGGDVGWDVVSDGYDRMLVDDSVRGETGDAEVMFDVSSYVGEQRRDRHVVRVGLP